MTRIAAADLALLFISAGVAAAQEAPATPFGLVDNSFLVEEAFNQDRGVVQNIFVLTRSRGGFWSGSFTQEWPAPGRTHQLSYSIPFTGGNETGSLGGVLLNYRYQVSDEGAGRVACAPRFSLITPSTADSGWGWQANLPVSKRFGAVYLHGNAGLTRLDSSTTPFFAGSTIVAVRPMFHLMLEVFAQNESGAVGETSTTILPGIRTGWNFGSKQFVIGAGVPITRGHQHDNAVLGYVSYELPFR